jgi:hypothetical protein
MDADGFEVGIDTDQAEALTLRWHCHVWTPLADQGLFSALR